MLNKSKKILHAPINIANRMTVLSNAQKEEGYVSHSCNYTNNWLQYKSDMTLNLENLNRVQKLIRIVKFFLKSIRKYDVFHFYFGESLLPRNIDLAILKFLGKKMVMHYCGSDVRIDSSLKENNKWAIPNTYEKEVVYKNIRRVSKYIDVAVVVDCELVDYVEPFFKHVYISHRAINLKEYEPQIPDINVKRPLIVHAPSDIGIKGTEFVLEAVDRLKEQYNFEFKLISGLKHEEAIRLFLEADIIVDQLLIGAHGFFAVEAMALGKPVICYIRPDLVNRYPPELPVVSANPETIYDAIEKLILEPQTRAELGRQGIEYVKKYHDAKKVSDELLRIYGGL